MINGFLALLPINFFCINIPLFPTGSKKFIFLMQKHHPDLKSRKKSLTSQRRTILSTQPFIYRVSISGKLSHRPFIYHISVNGKLSTLPSHSSQGFLAYQRPILWQQIHNNQATVMVQLQD